MSSNWNKKTAHIQRSKTTGNPSIRLHQEENMLPDPEVLERIERIYPGATKEIMQWTGGEQKHRHNTETKIVNKSFFLESFRLVLAFLICLSVFATGVYFMLNGHPNCGTTIITGTAVSLVIAFISTRKSNEKTK